MKKLLDAAVARLLLLLALRKPSPRGDIFVVTVPRSGLTWLCEILESTRRTRCVKEPLSPGDTPFFRGAYGIKPRRRYVGATPAEMAALQRFLSDVVSFRAMNWPRFRRFKLRTDLNVIVLSKAPNLAPWLEATFHCRILYLARHPIANAVSKARNRWHERTDFGGGGWAEFIDVYLNDEAFVAEHLDAHLVETAWRVRREGSDIERYVLNWCLDNLVPFREIARRPWLMVAYEDLVLTPDATLRHIVDHFHLDPRDLPRMRRRLGRPSGSSNMSETATLGHIRQGRADRLVSRWRREVPPETAGRCFEITAAFGMDLYTAEADTPNPRYADFRKAFRPDLPGYETRRRAPAAPPQ